MPNIGIHGYDKKTADELAQSIVECMQKIGLGKEAIGEIFPSTTFSCDGKLKPAPYLRIFSSEFSHIPIILDGFQKNGIHEDVEVISDKKMFFEKGEIASGEWKKQFPNASNTSECKIHGSIEHMQSVTGKCPGCGKP
jgi:hypothetical protein